MFESHGLLSISIGKREYVACLENNQTIYEQGKELKTVRTFEYLGSLFDAKGGVENISITA